MTDIFDFDIDTFAEEYAKPTTSTSINEGVYRSDPSTGKDGTFVALIRFLPNITNPKKPVVSKFTYWLTGQDGKGEYFDCPKSIGENSIIAETYFKLKNSPNEWDQEKAKKLQRKSFNFAYIQVVKDFQDSSNDGKIMLYRFPQTIMDQISSELVPSSEDVTLGKDPCNVFSPFDGKNFLLKVTTKSSYWNYDQCKFEPSPSCMKIDDKELTMDVAGKESLTTMLTETAETNNIDRFAYTPWDADKATRLKRILSALLGENLVEETAAATTTLEKAADNPLQSENTVKETVTENAGNGDDALDAYLKDLEG